MDSEKVVSQDIPPSLAPNSPEMPVPSRWVTCPNCYSQVNYASYCTNCGAPLSPPLYTPTLQQAPAKKRHSRALIIGIILAAILAASIAGASGYMNYQSNVLHAAQNTELIAANHAVDGLGFACFSVSSDRSHFNVGPPATGYVVILEKFGIHNNSNYPIDATWTVGLSYPALTVSLSSTSSFHLIAQGTSYPIFPFFINATQEQAFANVPAGTSPQYRFTLDGNYAVYGSYSTYNIDQHQSYDSSANNTSSAGSSNSTSTGQFGSNSNTTACP